MDCGTDDGREKAKDIAEGIAQGIAKGIAIGIAFFFAFVLFIFLGGIVVQWLWNWLMPDIFGLRELGFWEALGLLALGDALMGGPLSEALGLKRQAARDTAEALLVAQAERMGLAASGHG